MIPLLFIVIPLTIFYGSFGFIFMESYQWAPFIASFLASLKLVQYTVITHVEIVSYNLRRDFDYELNQKEKQIKKLESKIDELEREAS